MTADFLALAALAYLLGSIPFGKIVGRYRGIDIQKKGSGNIGFANVRRTLGWKLGLIVLAGDILKGLIPVLIARHYLNDWRLLVVALLAVLGHIFPVWLKFKGGKGIATGLGVSAALNPAVDLVAVAVYFLSLYFFKKSGPSSVAAFWSMPFACIVIDPKNTWFYLILALIATWTHRTNLRALRKQPAHAK